MKRHKICVIFLISHDASIFKLIWTSMSIEQFYKAGHLLLKPLQAKTVLWKTFLMQLSCCPNIPKRICS